MSNYEKIEPQSSYVVHVRVEKVVRYVNKTTSIGGTTETKAKEVEDVINVVKKDRDLNGALAFIKNTMDLVAESTEEEE
jgi:heptaprenylglyceryl phosphate synthase